MPVTGVSLEGSLTVTTNTSHRLSATLIPEHASNPALSWTSSDTDVAIVEADGTVVALSPGTVIITVTTEDGGHTAECTVDVKSAVEKVALDKHTLNLATTETAQLSAVVSPPDALQDVVWSSSDEGVATVDDSGLVSARNEGTAVITVTTPCGRTDSCTVTVTRVKVTGVKINRSSLKLATGDLAQLSATVSPANAAEKSVSWQSSNPDVATVNASGKLTAVSPGQCTVTVKTVDGAYTATCAVTVFAPTGKPGNSIGNLVNLGTFAYHDGWIYFSNPYDDLKLYKIRADGGTAYKLSNEYDTSGINIVDGWIYYQAVSGRNHRIFKIRPDGSGKQMLVTLPRSVDAYGNVGGLGRMMVMDGWIYMGNTNTRYRIDGSEKQECHDPFRSAIVDGWLYTSSESEIYRIRTDGGKREILYRGRKHIVFLHIIDGWMYFEDWNSVNRLKLGGTQVEKLIEFEGRFESMLVDEGWIYILEHTGPEKMNILRIRTDGSTPQKLIADENLPPISWLQVADGWLYYRTRAYTTRGSSIGDYMRLRLTNSDIKEPFAAYPVSGQIVDANNQPVWTRYLVKYTGKDLATNSNRDMYAENGNIYVLLYPGTYVIQIEVSFLEYFEYEFVVDGPISDLRIVLP
ncbi:MAG: DUF5050 domain-containing protein [Bacillota bacterium]